MDEERGEEHQGGEQSVGMGETEKRHGQNAGGDDASPMLEASLVEGTHDERQGRGNEGEADEIGEELSFQQKNPGEAGEGHGGDGAGSDDRAALGEERRHERQGA